MRANTLSLSFTLLRATSPAGRGFSTASDILHVQGASCSGYGEASPLCTFLCSYGIPEEAQILYGEQSPTPDSLHGDAPQRDSLSGGWYRSADGRLWPGYVPHGQPPFPVVELRRTELDDEYGERFSWLHQAIDPVEMQFLAPIGLTLLRSPGQTEFSDHELRIVNVLLPHMRRAFELHCRFVDLKTRSAGQSWALDQLPFGLVLVSEGRTVLHANSAAHRLCDGNGLRLTKRGVRATDQRKNKTLRAALQAARANSTGESVVTSVAVPCKDGGLLAVTVAPVTIGTIDWGRSLVAVFIQDPDLEPVDSERVLRSVHGLTAAECRLAALVASGFGIPDAAEKLEVNAETARSQLKSIFAKTGVTKQSQLARLLSVLSSPLACVRVGVGEDAAP